MLFRTVEFAGLSNAELHAIYSLRSQVFVVEQNCAYQDPDDKDPLSLHILGTDGNDLVAYARIIPPGISYREPSIGRVVVRKTLRQQGLGRKLMTEAIREAKSRFGDHFIVISAQCYLQNFYSSLGFCVEGNVYDEDGIPHIKMRLRVIAAS